MQRQSQVRGGQQTNRQMMENLNVAIESTEVQHNGITWAKHIALMCMTFGLICLLYFISYHIQHMKGTVLASRVDAGGLLLAFFLVYVISFGVAWFFGSRKRDQLRREFVQKQIAKQRARQALQNIQ